MYDGFVTGVITDIWFPLPGFVEECQKRLSEESFPQKKPM